MLDLLNSRELSSSGSLTQGEEWQGVYRPPPQPGATWVLRFLEQGSFELGLVGEERTILGRTLVLHKSVLGMEGKTTMMKTIPRATYVDWGSPGVQNARLLRIALP